MLYTLFHSFLFFDDTVHQISKNRFFKCSKWPVCQNNNGLVVLLHYKRFHICIRAVYILISVIKNTFKEITKNLLIFSPVGLLALFIRLLIESRHDSSLLYYRFFRKIPLPLQVYQNKNSLAVHQLLIVKKQKNKNRFVFTNKCHNTVLWKRLESSASMLLVVAWGSDRLDVKRTFGSNKWLVLKTRWFIVAVPVQVLAALVPCEINRPCSWMSHLVISQMKCCGDFSFTGWFNIRIILCQFVWHLRV